MTEYGVSERGKQRRVEDSTRFSTLSVLDEKREKSPQLWIRFLFFIELTHHPLLADQSLFISAHPVEFEGLMGHSDGVVQ